MSRSSCWLPIWARTSARRRRFQREARAAAGLSSHPNVVTIYDVGEHAGRVFMVMEIMRGGTARRPSEAGREDVSHDKALRWLREAAAALDAAHDAGVVHRDIKPGNLLLDARERLAVADFGIARLAWEDQLTATGQVLGTAAYLSPEQAMGEAATAASDRYALAVVAYELLTGDAPVRGRALRRPGPRPRRGPGPARVEPRRAPLSKAVDATLEKGLAKDPADRWDSAAAVRGRARAHARAAREETKPTRMLGRRGKAAARGRRGGRGGVGGRRGRDAARSRRRPGAARDGAPPTDEYDNPSGHRDDSRGRAGGNGTDGRGAAWAGDDGHAGRRRRLGRRRPWRRRPARRRGGRRGPRRRTRHATQRGRRREPRHPAAAAAAPRARRGRPPIPAASARRRRCSPAWPCWRRLRWSGRSRSRAAAAATANRRRRADIDRDRHGDAREDRDGHAEPTDTPTAKPTDTPTPEPTETATPEPTQTATPPRRPRVRTTPSGNPSRSSRPRGTTRCQAGDVQAALDQPARPQSTQCGDSAPGRSRALRDVRLRGGAVSRRSPGEAVQILEARLARFDNQNGTVRRAPQEGAQGRQGQAARPSERRSRASVTTASAACAPWSRLPPPVRASAWSMFSTVSTPNAHGTPVRSWTSMIPRAASAQT